MTTTRIIFTTSSDRPYASDTEVHVDGPEWTAQTSDGLVVCGAHFALDATDPMDHRAPGSVVRDHSARVTLNLPTVERHHAGEITITPAEAREVAAALMAAAGFARLCTRTVRPSVYSPFVVTDDENTEH